MAITLSDFDNIWASSSPLTPYSFTDANYKEGWNFIGATPPSRQMWDFLQKNNDEKAKYIVDNYLALSGGTMTGDIVRTAGSLAVASADDGYIQLYGGTGYDHGAWFQLCGKDHSNTGRWSLQANNGTNRKALIGNADGTLTWDGKAVIVGTEASESTSFSSIGGNATVNYTLSHKARYYSITMSGTGYAFMNVTMSTDQQTINVYNTTGTARSNIGLTVRYIY